MKPGWVPQVIAMSGVTDAYQPAERKLRITRGCLEVLAEFRNPVAIITKNRLVARDSDILSELARLSAAVVFVSVTSLDADLARALEPRASTPSARLDAIARLAGAGVPVGVAVAPVIPGLTDHEMPAILKAAAEAGARAAFYTILRLPLGVGDLFTEWLDRHAPLAKEKVLGRLKGMRGGRLNDARFGHRMGGDGAHADLIRTMFRTSVARVGLDKPFPELSTAGFRRPGQVQLSLFD
jgi:DNA repair photolyase